MKWAFICIGGATALGALVGWLAYGYGTVITILSLLAALAIGGLLGLLGDRLDNP